MAISKHLHAFSDFLFRMPTPVKHRPLGLGTCLLTAFTAIALHPFLGLAIFHHVPMIDLLILFTGFVQAERANCCYLLFFHDVWGPLLLPVFPRFYQPQPRGRPPKICREKKLTTYFTFRGCSKTAGITPICP